MRSLYNMNENDDRQSIMPEYIRVSLVVLVISVLVALIMIAAVIAAEV